MSQKGKQMLSGIHYSGLGRLTHRHLNPLNSEMSQRVLTWLPSCAPGLHNFLLSRLTDTHQSWGVGKKGLRVSHVIDCLGAEYFSSLQLPFSLLLNEQSKSSHDNDDLLKWCPWAFQSFSSGWSSPFLIYYKYAFSLVCFSVVTKQWRVSTP